MLLPFKKRPRASSVPLQVGTMPDKMTTSDAARIQSAAAKAGDGGVAKGSFPARAQAAAATNSAAGQGDGGAKAGSQ